MPSGQTVDITPSPRILHVLGEIPFQPWQCLAELMDNSIDALLKQPDSDEHKAVYVSWSSQAVANKDRTIEVSDNAHGMTLEQMRNAVRAGYSQNNPIDNLGLFGMGFNIATARLGNKVEIWSTTADDTQWSGIEIDFEVLSKGSGFQVPVRHRKKEPGDVSGTQVAVTNLRSGAFDALCQHERDLRNTLENIYAPLLLDNENIDLYVKGKILHPKQPCVWSEERFVNYKGHKIPAVFNIDQQLGSALFDLDKNAYLTPAEQEEFENIPETDLPENLCYRERRLYGWLGIQRYFDTNDYGIDFIRNGRKILIRDKSFFSYTSQITGESKLQYPVELGTTVGGRIVGELHVDYLLPTYQKNDFDRYDATWYETKRIICGEGPFLPRDRKALGLDEFADTPLGQLVNAYRRTEAGTKNLALPKNVAKEFLQEFNKGNKEYLDDSKWWAAAQEADQKRHQDNNPPANTGSEPSDELGSFFPNGQEAEAGSDVTEKGAAAKEKAAVTSKAEDLRKSSGVVKTLSHNYYVNIGKNNNPIKATVYQLAEGEILQDGERVPFVFFPKGRECEFYYDPRHPLIQQYPVTPAQYLLLYLSDLFQRRDQYDDLGAVYGTLVGTYMEDERIDAGFLREKAESFFEDMRAPLKHLLEPVSTEVVSYVHEESGDKESAIERALQEGESFSDLKPDSPTAYNILDHVSYKTLLKLIEKYPEYIFDGQLIDESYTEIELEDEAMQDRLRESAKERIVACFEDLLHIVNAPGSSITTNDLRRASLSLETLTDKLVKNEFSD